MRLLADENFPLAVVEDLGDHGHDVAWARTDFPGVRDNSLMDLAESQGRSLLTLDKDFWQLALQRRQPLRESGVIVFRIHPATPANLLPVVRRALESSQDWRGHASVVTADRAMMVHLPNA